jgi:type VI secretion system VasD/TssJ family lipoprotein
MRITKTLLLLAVILLQACSLFGGNEPKDAKAEVNWGYQKNGIMLNLLTSKGLNWQNNQEHTLVFAVYQFSDEKTFLKLLANPADIQKSLVNGQNVDGILQLDRYILMPGKQTTVQLDRVQNTKFVGFIAGYYNFDAAANSRYYRIPLNMSSEGIISTTYKASPAILAVKLSFSNDRINDAQLLTYDADKKVLIETVPLNNKNTEIKITPESINKAKDASEAVIHLTN